jgi:Tfp pilus assembly protein PilN
MNAPNQVSFLPDDYLRMKRQRRANAICAGLFMVVLVAIGAAFSVSESRKKDADRQLQQINERYAKAARPIELFRQLQERQRHMNSQAALAAALLEKVPRSYLLAQVTNALPHGVSLLEFSLDAKPRNRPAPPAARAIGLPPPQHQSGAAAAVVHVAHPESTDEAPQPRAYDTTLRIVGVADNDVQVAGFITTLSKSPLLQDVNLVVSEEYELDKHNLRKFQIETTLNPDAQVNGVFKKPSVATAQ